MTRSRWEGSGLEDRVASAITATLSDVSIGAELILAPSSDVCSALEYFLPVLLRDTYPEWRWESLDGLYVCRARRASETAIELLGTCILITDQRVTSFFAALSVVPSRVESFDVRIGEEGEGALGISGPPCNSGRAGLLLHALRERADRDEVRWVCRVAG